MRPEHISFYSLQIEEGTPLYKDFAAEKIQIPSWEENREMYHSAIRQIKEHGYHHYEVSNAALPGFECRHNLKYWTMQPYLGFGISAHSFIPVYGENARLTAGYRGEAAWSCTGEPQSLADLKGDFIFTQLRLTEGLNASFYRQLFGEEFSADFGKALEELAAKGYIIDTERGVRLTEKGLDNINPVMQTLLEELQWKRNT